LLPDSGVQSGTLSEKTIMATIHIPVRAALVWLLALVSWWSSPGLVVAQSLPTINLSNITIIRDAWGVPHIYSQTDVEASYGLAWAHAEDDFKTIQEMLLVCRGRYGEIAGPGGAALDFMLAYTGLKETVAQRYLTDVSEQFRNMCEAYAAAINEYAARFPQEVLKKDVFPVTGQDLVVGYVFTTTLFTGLPFVVQRILGNDQNNYEEGFFMEGSNAMAFNRGKTVDGKVYLAVNSHQPLEGLFSWYEVHIETQEGWNMLGGVFPGGNLIFHGTKPMHGWAATINWPDLVDMYELRLNPQNKNQYWFDGKWENLETCKAKLRVKVGGVVIPVTKTFYRTKYGPALKNKTGIFATRVGTLMDIRVGDQLYKMNKARNLDEFKDALRMRALGSINLVYADKDQNLFYISNGLIPKRQPGHNWRKVVRGDTSATLWTEYVPLDRLPQVQNPSCGFIFNTNNTPLTATCTAENRKAEEFPAEMGIQVWDNNRSRRFMELVDNGQKITYEDFKRIKYDLKYPSGGAFIESLKPLFNLDPAKYPDVADAIRIMQRWNRVAHKDNTDCALLVVAFWDLFKKYHGGSVTLERGFENLKEEDIVEAVRKARKFMLKHYGKLDPPFGTLQRHRKGSVDLPMSGVPDVLAAMLSNVQKDGRYKAAAGESYIQLAVFGPDGIESLETINAYGASNKPQSPHYTDQMERFVNQQTKTMTFERSQIEAQAERIYHPGGAAVKKP
jgi:acyl-homoserine-lactone acylase